MNDESDRTDSFLSAVLFRASCPAPDELLQYQTDGLSPFEQQRIAGHVAGCPHCSGELAYLSVEASPSLLDRLRSWLADQIANRPALTLQPIAQPKMALRGVADTRQDFAQGNYRVSLSLSPNLDGTLALTGSTVNIADPLIEFDGTAVFTDSETVVKASIDSFGYFAVPDLPFSTFAVLLKLSEQIIVIDAVDASND